MLIGLLGTLTLTLSLQMPTFAASSPTHQLSATPHIVNNPTMIIPSSTSWNTTLDWITAPNGENLILLEGNLRLGYIHIHNNHPWFKCSQRNRSFGFIKTPYHSDYGYDANGNPMYYIINTSLSKALSSNYVDYHIVSWLDGTLKTHILRIAAEFHGVCGSKNPPILSLILPKRSRTKGKVSFVQHTNVSFNEYSLTPSFYLVVLAQGGLLYRRAFCVRYLV